jgi:hypothetical protein
MENNMFAFSITQGVVPARASVRVIITFNPTETTYYYERVFWLVRNHKLLYLDLIGTWYDILTKPLPLMQKHVEIFRYKVIMGTHYKKKRNLDDEDDEDGQISEDLEIPTNTLDYEETKMTLDIPLDEQNNTLHKEMMLENESEMRDVSILQQYLDFNYWEYGLSSEYQEVNVENRFPFDIQVKWIIPDVMNWVGEIVK